MACGVHAALLDSQGGALCEASAPCLSSSPDVRSPRFHLRLELRRGDEMPADSTLVISVVAVQEGTEAEGLRQVGFGAIAPFAGCSGSADAGKQPSSSLEREVG